MLDDGAVGIGCDGNALMFKRKKMMNMTPMMIDDKWAEVSWTNVYRNLYSALKAVWLSQL